MAPSVPDAEMDRALLDDDAVALIAALSRGAALRDDHLTLLAATGRTRVLRWLRGAFPELLRNGHGVCLGAAVAAAKTGKLDVARLAEAAGCPWARETAEFFYGLTCRDANLCVIPAVLRELLAIPDAPVSRYAPCSLAVTRGGRFELTAEEL